MGPAPLRLKRITNGDGDSKDAAISADAKHIAYISQATNLVKGVADLHQNVFVWVRGPHVGANPG